MTRGTYEALGGKFEVPDVEGRLRISLVSEAGAAGGLHRTDFVPGADYHGMEDNDIRGFLDGTFLYGWNQASQKYVRAGRLNDVWGYGEYELFRVLHRWDDLRLPSGAGVEDAELVIHMGPYPPDCRLKFFLYPVKNDWVPGEGGVGQDNASPPVQDEVWWNDRRFGAESWGLPGASSSEDLEGSALAACVVEAGGERVEFRSAALTGYAKERCAAGLPLLFLLRLQSVQEDIPGSLAHLWAATEGENRNQGRKPRLSLFWRAPEQAVLDRTLLVEHRTSVVLPLESGNVVEFTPAEGSDPPELATRAPEGDWTPVTRGFVPDGHSELRVRAVRDPIVFGDPFEAEFRDTWIRTARPEEQVIPWFFTSPTGREVVIQARFEGDFTWKIQFTPDEVGRWRFHWRHDLQAARYESQVEVFDVMLEAKSQAADALKHFLSLSIAGRMDSREELSRMMVRFSKLEREVMGLLEPADYRSEVGLELVGLMRQIRSELGAPVPEPIPMKGADPQLWETR
ncbi:MAG: hypothetical protein ACR2QM_08930 [Longimicrobiales bacterium]